MTTITAVTGMTRILATNPPVRFPDLASMTPQQMIVATLLIFHRRIGPAEIRCLNVLGKSNRTDSGYFDDAKSAATAAMKYRTGKMSGTYFTLNELNPALLARSNNRMTEYATNATSDGDIIRRRWLYLDFDPERPSGISSTEKELSETRSRAADTEEWLLDHGFPKPIVALSGNGIHLHFPIDLPNDDASSQLIRGVLAALNVEFSDNIVKVDQAVWNAARICRLYGTMACKGDSSENRPHRRSEILSIPDYLYLQKREVCDVEALRTVAAMAPASANQKSPQNSKHPSETFNHRLLVPDYLNHHGIKHSSKDGKHGFTNFILDQCVFCGNKSPDSMVTQSSQGALGFKCLHNSCNAAGWTEFKEKLGNPLPEHYDPPMPEKKARKSKESGSAAKKDNGKGDAADIDPCTEATNFLNANFSHEDGYQLLYYRDDYYRWCGTVWRIIPLVEIRGYIALHLAKLYEGVGSSAVSNVLEFVRAITNTPSSFETPCWMDGREGYSIAFQNGITMLEDLLSEKPDCLIPHTPLWFSTTVLPYDYNPTATCEQWENVLNTNLESDQERIQLLQEFSGYCLTKWVFYHLMLMLTGDGGEGKSVFLSGLIGIIGDKNCSKLSLDDLGHNFKRTAIVDKLANVCADVSETSKTCEGVLKQLISGDAMEFDRKYKEPISAIPTAKLIFSANNLPHFYDRTNGIWRRVTIVPFRREVMTDELVEGMDKPEWWQKQRQLSGMFNWALNGLKRLQKNRSFTKSAVCEAATQEHKLSCNPARSFLDDEYTLAENDTTPIPVSFIYGEYRKHCSSIGCMPLGNSQFGKEVAKKFRQLKKIRTNLSGFVREWCYVGIRKKTVGDEPLESSYDDF